MVNASSNIPSLAMADFVLIEDGSLDVSLDGFTSVNRWEKAFRPNTEELYGGGTLVLRTKMPPFR